MGAPGGVAGHPRGPFAVHSFPDPLNASMDSIWLKMDTSGFQPKSLGLLEVQGGQVLPHQVSGDGVVGDRGRHGTLGHPPRNASTSGFHEWHHQTEGVESLLGLGTSDCKRL